MQLNVNTIENDDNNKIKFVGDRVFEFDIKKESIVITFENITIIPKEIKNLQNLTYLELNSNKIRKIPEEIGNLKNLYGLFLYGNRIQEIPKEIGNLKALRILVLSENQLTEILKTMSV